MSLEIVSGKGLAQINFLESTIYERYDLTDSINVNDRFIIRQGDLIVSNYEVDTFRRVGIRTARLSENDGIFIFRNSHYIIPSKNQTILLHNEHGVTVIPLPLQKLNFYTFAQGGD